MLQLVRVEDNLFSFHFSFSFIFLISNLGLGVSMMSHMTVTVTQSCVKQKDMEYFRTMISYSIFTTC